MPQFWSITVRGGAEAPTGVPSKARARGEIAVPSEMNSTPSATWNGPFAASTCHVSVPVTGPGVLAAGTTVVVIDVRVGMLAG